MTRNFNQKTATTFLDLQYVSKKTSSFGLEARNRSKQTLVPIAVGKMNVSFFGSWVNSYQKHYAPTVPIHISYTIRIFRFLLVSQILLSDSQYEMQSQTVTKSRSANHKFLANYLCCFLISITWHNPFLYDRTS